MPAKNRPILLMIFVVLLALPAVSHAQDGDEPPSPFLLDEDGNPQSCGDCHIDVVEHWQTSSHALTFGGDAFQQAWQDIDQAPLCLECHTTGFSVATGEFTHQGVSCEACHGNTPASHPDEPITVEPGLAICTDCHVTTFQEWSMSGHGNQELACTTCHNPHPQQVRFDTNTELCLNCHADEYQADLYSHATHVEQACTDCHWHRSPADNTLHVTTGELPPSGHDAWVETLACDTCHAELASGERDATEIASNAPLVLSSLDARVQIDELEAEVAETRAQGENSAAVHLIQGLIVGGALGVVMALVISRVQLRTRGGHTDE